LNYLYLKRCSNPILVYMSGKYFPKSVPAASKGTIVFGEKIFSTLSNLLKPITGQEPHIIYCLHTEREEGPMELENLAGIELPLNTTISLCRNTLIFPILLWEWYGFPHWIEIDDFLQKYGSPHDYPNK
jgi:hypothetical protein